MPQALPTVLAMRPLCIFHAHCLDGLGAAAVVRRRFPDCDLLAMQHGDTPPVVEGRDLVMVDFGLPLPAMRTLRAQARSFTWLDHHRSQLEVHRQLGLGVLDIAECGASLTWRELFPGEPVPPIIAYIKDKDLWTWALPESRAVAAGVWATFQNGKDLPGLLAADPMAMAAIGRPFLLKQQQRVHAAVQTGKPMSDAFGLAGVRAFAVPARGDLNEIADHILAATDNGGLGYDLAVMFYRKRNGAWIHSLRSERIDCLSIAMPRGGGGHPAAACFLAKVPQVPCPPVSPTPPPGEERQRPVIPQ